MNLFITLDKLCSGQIKMNTQCDSTQTYTQVGVLTYVQLKSTPYSLEMRDSYLMTILV